MHDLTRRELDVLGLMAQALSNRDIANKLSVSVETVRMHAKRIYSKLGVSGRQEASFKALELGLVELPSIEVKLNKINLPHIVEDFIGRKRELADLSGIVAQGRRLVTILGTGGMGKTRLAIQFAHQQQKFYADGVYFVPLETVTATENIVLQIVDSLSLHLTANATPKQQLVDHLVDKQLLLVIDNWEHLLDGAILINDLLLSAPSIHILTTSRERLNLRQEAVYTLGGLNIPQSADYDSLWHNDAVQLLRRTAQQVKPNWDIRQNNLMAIYDLCQLTLGMPLGIVLAAGWLDVYPLDRIVNEIRDNIGFLETDLRDVPKRHRSIRAVFDWTWGLLSQAEKNVFMKLSVFRNGCDISAAEAVSGATPRILQSLVNKALIRRTEKGRYVLHELLRQYGEKQLHQNPAINQKTRDDHSHYYVDFTERVLTNRVLPGIAEVDLENLYVAWYWIIDTLNIDLLWRAICVYGMSTFQFGSFSEMKIIFDYAIEQIKINQCEQSKLLGSLYYINAAIHYYLIHDETADKMLAEGDQYFEGVAWEALQREMIYAHYHAALALRRSNPERAMTLVKQITHYLESQDLTEDALGQTMLTYAHSQHTVIYIGVFYDYVTGEPYALKALTLARQIQQISIIGLCTQMLAEMAFYKGDYKLAYQYIKEAEQAYDGMLNTFDFAILKSLSGRIALAEKDYEGARDYLYETILILKDYGLLGQTTKAIMTIVDWQIQMKEWERATEIIAYLQITNFNITDHDRIADLQEILQVQLSERIYQKAVERGQRMDFTIIMREIMVWLED